MKKAINLIFPHQLFAESPLLQNGHVVYLIEEYLFFRQYRFHKQKIAFHRASMKYYQHYLEEKGMDVRYIESGNQLADIRRFRKEISERGISEIHLIDPTDNWLEQRIRHLSVNLNIKLHNNPQFFNSEADLASFFRPEKKSFFQTSFYKTQRKKREVLMDAENQPMGGKWTYDTENRKKYPKGKTPPVIRYPGPSKHWKEAVTYTRKHFAANPGALSEERMYPVTHQEAEEWFQQFLEHRFYEFGPYEDAILKEQSILHHSILSPLLNTGLLLPEDVLDKSLLFAEKENIPINSREGFIRQLMGWREFIRGMYICKGSYSRTRNFWKFQRKIPACFYQANTGIGPLDETIQKVLQTGYCHHIERLMVLGNFMLLCEFDPDDVYRWFMELFIDAFDWVMVPNVYGMSQFADGGTFATKPYIGGANYIRKMSNYPQGEWEGVWNGLFWRFIDKHQDFFASNPRTSMLVHAYNRMTSEKKRHHHNMAEQFIREKLNKH